MNHYEALELTTSATADDIRKAYRRLVLLTHPDRTPDPAAHAQYLLVNAAYEVLSDPARRAAYDHLLLTWRPSPEATMSPGRQQDAAARRHRASPKVASTPVDYAVEHARFYRRFRPILIAALLVCISLMADYVAATERIEVVQSAEVKVYYTSSGGRYSRSQPHYYYNYTTDRGTFDADDEIQRGAALLVERTPLWGGTLAARHAQSKLQKEPIVVRQRVGYGFWWSLFLTTSLALIPGFKGEFRLIAGVAAIVSLLLTLLQLLP